MHSAWKRCTPRRPNFPIFIHFCAVKAFLTDKTQSSDWIEFLNNVYLFTGNADDSWFQFFFLDSKYSDFCPFLVHIPIFNSRKYRKPKVSGLLKTYKMITLTRNELNKIFENVKLLVSVSWNEACLEPSRISIMKPFCKNNFTKNLHRSRSSTGF